MKKLTMSLLSLTILMFVGLGQASAEVFPADVAYPIVTCDSSKPIGGGSGGGVVVLPWSSAKPFPWTSIQGVWVASAEKSQDLYFSFRVTRTTNKLKQLAVEVYQQNNCKKPLMRGVGVQSNSDKNVIRVMMNNYLLKLGSFNTADLDMNPAVCGYRSLGATFHKLSNNNESSRAYPNGTVEMIKAKNVLLKKVSNSLAPKCKNN